MGRETGSESLNSGVEAKENPQQTLSQLETNYAQLVGIKDVSAWKALDQNFSKNEGLKKSPALSPDQRAEFVRKSAFVKLQILQLKYEPTNSLLGYSMSKVLPLVSRADRLKDKAVAQKASALYAEAISMFEAAGVPSSDPRYTKAQRGLDEGSLVIEEMFEKFENGIQAERARIATDATDYVKKNLELSDNDELTVNISSDGSMVSVSAMKGNEMGSLEFSVGYDHFYVYPNTVVVAEASGVLQNHGQAISALIKGEHPDYPRKQEN